MNKPISYPCYSCGLNNNIRLPIREYENKPCNNCVIGNIVKPCHNQLHWINTSICNSCNYEFRQQDDVLCKGCGKIYTNKTKTYCSYCKDLFCCYICQSDIDIQFYPNEDDPLFSEFVFCRDCLMEDEHDIDRCLINGCCFKNYSYSEYCKFHCCLYCYQPKEVHQDICDICNNAELALLDVNMEDLLN